MNQTQELQTTVQGMACAMCVKNVHNALTGTPGVQQAEVSLEGGAVRVLYDPQQTTPRELKERVDALGYTMQLPEQA